MALAVADARSLLLICAVGAILLLPHLMTRETARRAAYWSLHLWQTSFDAISAACGAGLLTYHPQRAYTDIGIATLTLLAVAGAIWFVGACARAEARLGIAPFCATRRPAATARVAWLITAGCCAAIASMDAFPQGFASIWRPALSGLRTAAGFGAAPPESLPITTAICAMSLLLPSIVTFWLLRRSIRDIWRPVSRQIACSLGLLLFLVFASALFEQPRRFGAAARGADSAAPASEGVMGRGIRAIHAMVGAANGVGSVPPDAGLRDGSRVVLAAAILIGGGAGSAAGGLRWTLLAALCARGGGGRAADAARRTARALLLLTGGIAMGILLIDALVGVRFGRAVPLGDALLDAASAVGGGAVGGAAMEAITSRNLSTGIGHASDLYPYGMLWLMIAMVLGRLVPLWVMQRAAERPERAQPDGAARH
ncbi:MAG: hypothetical protein IPM64_08760 [Phycisphaerales bacterium]|nr:hypothetical protein [Phycisphaerales bacterium]